MSLPLTRILIIASFVLFLTLFIGCSHAMNVPDLKNLANPETEVETAALIHEMAKRRFLPTRRDLLEQLEDAMDQSESHSNIKRYFLKTKRDFLDSEQDLN